jgi:hypothetical protein
MGFKQPLSFLTGAVSFFPSPLKIAVTFLPAFAALKASGIENRRGR